MGDPQFGQQPFSIDPQILGKVQHAKIVTIRVPVFTVGEESGTYIITLYLYNNTEFIFKVTAMSGLEVGGVQAYQPIGKEFRTIFYDLSFGSYGASILNNS